MLYLALLLINLFSSQFPWGTMPEGTIPDPSAKLKSERVQDV